MCLDIAHCARIPVPVPRAAEVACDIDYPNIADSGLSEPSRYQQPSPSASKNQHLRVRGYRVTRRLIACPRVVRKAREAASRRVILSISIGPNPAVSLKSISLAKLVDLERNGFVCLS